MYVGERFPVIIPGVSESVFWWHRISGLVRLWLYEKFKKKHGGVVGSYLGRRGESVWGYDVAARQYFEGSTDDPCLQRELATTSRD